MTDSGSTEGTIKINPCVGSTGDTATGNFIGRINDVEVFRFEDNGAVFIYEKEMEKDASFYERFIGRHRESTLEPAPPSNDLSNITLSIEKDGEWEKLIVFREEYAIVRGEVTTDRERILATMREFLDHWEEVRNERIKKASGDGKGQGGL